ncbi:MAG TPA: ABC transporter permease [Candidatus Solibacter sp.]|nr:ABC transporter permease [Candidatus Solibacter sp.]
MFDDLFFRLRSLVRRKAVESEADTELRFHFDQQVEKYLKSGMTREEATRRARLEFGGHEQLKEELREARGVNLLETFLQDVRYGLRILGRTPVITCVAILSLALGIGANTAIFSLIDTVMLRMLPVERPEELVQVRMRSPRDTSGESNPTFTNPIWEEMRNHQDVFSGVFAWGEERFDLAQGGAVQRADGFFASGDYFSTLGVRPAAGRLFSGADDKRGCAGAAVLSYGFWQNHFGGAPSAIGSTLSLNNHSFEIIGVSAPGFFGVDVGNKFDVALPICAAAQFDGAKSRLDQRSWWWLRVLGRPKLNLTPAQLNARLGVLSPQVFSAAAPQNWDAKHQQDFLKRTFVTTSAGTGVSYVRREFGQPLNILMGVVGLVLLIACANIASLMLARAAARHKEIAVRKALGASRSRLIRQLLTESVLLSSAGAMLGILFARWGSTVLVRYISTKNDSVFLDLSFDWRILIFTAGVAVFTGLLFGVLPALRSTRVSLTSAMKGSQAVETEGRAKFRPGKWIVASQVALSLVLLMASGLFLRSFVKLVTIDMGFDRNNVLLVSADLHTAGVAPEAQAAMFDEIENRLRSLPGIVSAGRSVITPVSNRIWNNLLEVDTPNAPKGEDAVAYLNYISPGYFGTMKTPLLAGRNFEERDAKTSAPVAIVNETLARRFYSNANPVGKVFRVHAEPGKTAAPIQIVGLVKDSKYESLREDNSATAYFPIGQVPEHAAEQSFELRTATRPSSLIPAVQEAVAGVSKAIPLEFGTLAQQVDDSLVQERLLATLSTFFGALALLLAMIGLYGALSYLVAQRQIEFGIRRALGAPQNAILGLVMKDVVVVLLGGIAAGVCISLATVGLLQKMLFGLAPRDTVTLLASVGVLSAVAFFAGYLPARRAMRVDPMVALRYE